MTKIIEEQIEYKLNNAENLFYNQPFCVREKFINDLEIDLYKYASSFISSCPKCFCENVHLSYRKHKKAFEHKPCNFYFNPRTFLTNKSHEKGFNWYKELNKFKQDHWMILY
ncbi:hypothetical protein C4M96_00975 [Mycoplasmopsis pullorum]|uniref:hypothetical protein n=1 Tax=Mycoplasmopsis pullorum TaxID=48003 RepID=UPI001118ED8D|nr:hypothetical protein [Mycoplasmopsis pullorum]TNK84054.1 hypothetical protein C4M93_00180 [Mycoplasmopsis pullorum]TNK92433.1 hypothetical protein C4M96_00975 [Mycoplasmopsis pullorum]